MKLKRKHLVTLVFVAILASCLGVLYYRATVPFDTAHQFIRHIHAHRFNAAKSMIAADNLGKLPPEYWDRLASTEFNDDMGWSVSYTPESLLHSVVIFWVNVPDGDDWIRDSSVQYFASGRLIKIQYSSL